MCLDNFTHNNTWRINSTGPSAISFLLAYWKKKSIDNSLAMPTFLLAHLPVFTILVELVWGLLLGPVFAVCFFFFFWFVFVHSLFRTWHCFAFLSSSLTWDSTWARDGTGSETGYGIYLCVAVRMENGEQCCEPSSAETPFTDANRLCSS